MRQEDELMIEALLESERNAPGMPDEVASRLSSRLGVTIAIAPALPGSSATDAVATASGLTAAKLAKVGATLLVGATLGVGIDRAVLLPLEQARESSRGEQVILTLPPRDAGIDASIDAATSDASFFVDATSEPVSVRRREAPSAPDAGTPRSRPASDDVDAERLWLERAEAAFGRGDATAALQALDVHRRRFPNAALREERDALHVRALYLAGRREEGDAEAGRFRARYPNSVFYAQIARSRAAAEE